MSRTAGDDEQRERAADYEGSNEEGEGRIAGRATAKRVKKRVSAARARATAMVTATWVAGDKEGEGDGGKGDGGKCDGDEGEGRRQRGRWRRRRGWRVTERGRVKAATAMEAAMKASDGDEGDGEGDSGGG